MKLTELQAAVRGSAAALRSRTILQPVGGEGDKVFPPTFNGGVYAMETRRVNGVEVPCVLLDSVASQANRAEEALLAAVRTGELELPLIEVDFSGANASLRKPLPNLTSLEVPHRLADAILRDSQLPDGTRFSKSPFAREWVRANVWNATPVYRLCPTAIVFGMWGSPEKPGGLGAKFERAFVSEIVGVGVSPLATRSGFRIDPVAASSKVAVLPNADGGFNVAADKAKNAVRPSEINHSNILYESKNGGARFDYAEQVSVVSIGALRKLRFPVDGRTSLEIDSAGRTVLAALALYAGVLAAERGTSLRSRCHLWPTTPRRWELLDTPGTEPKSFDLSSQGALELLKGAVADAEALGLVWQKDPIRLLPTPELVELVRRSQEVQATEAGDGE